MDGERMVRASYNMQGAADTMMNAGNNISDAVFQMGHKVDQFERSVCEFRDQVERLENLNRSKNWIQKLLRL